MYPFLKISSKIKAYLSKQIFPNNDDHFLEILPCLFPLLDLVDYVVRYFAIFPHAQHIVPLVKNIVSI